MNEIPPKTQKGRGAISNPEGRFEATIKTVEDDGWFRAEDDDFPGSTTPTQYFVEPARSVLTRNDSPDVPFSQSINPYRGCEHGCIYCFARPTHSYLGLSAGLDFETKIFCKDDAPALLAKELAKPSYQCDVIAMGTATDPYQPIEKEKRITRRLLEVMAAHRQPVSIVTKSALVTRDKDLLADLAKDQLAEVTLSVTTLSNDLKRLLEPRTPTGQARLAALRELHDAGIPVGVLFAPVIPFINDSEMEAILQLAREAGADYAGYVFLRLPYEVKDIFREWLTEHYPQKAEHVMSLVQQSRGGKDNVAEFGERMRGTGQYAELLRQRFKLTCRKLGFNKALRCQLRTDLFKVPGRAEQMSLF
ncbi:PA0069 family radical SAM protein [Permianibacter sp. IMCC34836]|uniref:PA0069 family radical SAM protein n=1 Tax=Permianibacter fluminis TaxID=2738515 RepID=UPI00155772CD|nr:PA0069 family radical SAM protein [Permianibacter fluminis]NQD37319.1 PA0069 family radical SAM protein [Permianibacter fluminis]